MLYVPHLAGSAPQSLRRLILMDNCLIRLYFTVTQTLSSVRDAFQSSSPIRTRSTLDGILYGAEGWLHPHERWSWLMCRVDVYHHTLSQNQHRVPDEQTRTGERRLNTRWHFNLLDKRQKVLKETSKQVACEQCRFYGIKLCSN